MTDAIRVIRPFPDVVARRQRVLDAEMTGNVTVAHPLHKVLLRGGGEGGEWRGGGRC